MQSPDNNDESLIQEQPSNTFHTRKLANHVRRSGAVRALQMGLTKRAMDRKMNRSRRMTGPTFGRCTLTATSSPVSRSTALYTWDRFFFFWVWVNHMPSSHAQLFLSQPERHTAQKMQQNLSSEADAATPSPTETVYVYSLYNILFLFMVCTLNLQILDSGMSPSGQTARSEEELS